MNSKLSTQVKQILKMMKEHEGIEYIAEDDSDLGFKESSFDILYTDYKVLVNDSNRIIEIYNKEKLIIGSVTTSPLELADHLVTLLR